MPNSTKIALKRTQEKLENITLRSQKLSFGEPLFLDNNEAGWGDILSKCNSYLAIGSCLENGTVNQAAIFKGFWDVTKANSLVFFKSDRKGLIDESGNQVYADRVISEAVSIDGNQNDETKYFVLCQPNVSEDSSEFGSVKTFNLINNTGIYVSSKGVFHGSAWNDYAECRDIKDDIFKIYPGDVVCESGNGTLELSSRRLQPCAYVVSDSYGVVLGENIKHNYSLYPIAVAGRVLVNVNEENVKVGDCVCAGVNGKAYVMSRDEIKEFPDRILGIVSEIPDYDTWKNGLSEVKVNNRVWIKIK